MGAQGTGTGFSGAGNQGNQGTVRPNRDVKEVRFKDEVDEMSDEEQEEEMPKGRAMKGPRMPTAKEFEEHMATHTPFRDCTVIHSWLS